MKKILIAILTLSIFLIAFTTAALATETTALPSNVFYQNTMYDSNTSLVTARMTFRSGMDGIVLMAVYNQSGTLKNVAYADAPSEYADFTISLVGDKSYIGCPVKLFFWDSLNTLIPLNTTICTGVVEQLPSSLAVIKEIGNAIDENGENIWNISYMINSKEVPALTTPEVAKGTKPTIGDLVKISTDDVGIITKIVTVWDFAKGIRVARVTELDGTENDYALPVANAELIAANSAGGEAYYGGYVTNFYKASKIIVVGGKEFKLTTAENIYVIDTTGRKISIENCSAGDFGYNQMLYSGVNTVDVYDSDGRIVFEDLETSIAQKYADHVYVRLYEDRPIDVFIVKGADLSFE